MQPIIFALLVWAGAGNGGPAAVQGFDSAEACQAARPVVEAAYADMVSPVHSRCVALARAVPPAVPPRP